MQKFPLIYGTKQHAFKLIGPYRNIHCIISTYELQILDRIRGFPIVIVEGPTGCGKTTQVPQWILDDCYKYRKPCKIIVTQPRRIAAMSIAKRVAQERGWDVGGLVGYQVRIMNTYSYRCAVNKLFSVVITGNG